jgi:hypothetical protein
MAVASGTITVTVADAKPVRELVDAATKVIEARAAGADLYEAQDEVDALENALALLSGYIGCVCSICGEPYAPRHGPHLDAVTWIEGMA